VSAILRSVTGAAIDAAVAGALVGAADVAVLALRGDLRLAQLPAVAAIAVGLAIALVVVAGIPAIFVLRAVGRHPWIRGVADGLARGGAARVEALARIVIAIGGIAALWSVGYAIVAGLFGRFRHVGGAAMLISTLVVVSVITLVTGGAALVGPVSRAAARLRPLATITTGRAGAGLAGVATLGAIAGLHLTVNAIAPSWDPMPAWISLIAVAALGLAAARPISRHRRAWIAGALTGLLATGGLATVGSSTTARGAIAGAGTISRAALVGLWWLSDRDRDGFAARFGGADCDDGDPAVNPAAHEIPGNRRDDNCILGDAAAVPAHRASPRPSRDPHAARRDIVLVTIDTLRADHVAAYGYRRPTTPALDAIAARGVRFEQAYTPGPSTRAALPALLFGRYTSTLPYRRVDGLPQLAPTDLPSLAATLRAAGYATATTLRDGGVLIETALVGFDDLLGGTGLHSSGSRATRAALGWIRAQPRDRPIFLWVHYMNPHAPYRPATARFGHDALARYDAEIAEADAELGRLVDGLAGAGRLDGAIVAVAADHGESFGEHGAWFHNQNLDDAQTRVPLVIAVPGTAPRAVTGPVSLVDLAPTLLDLTGVTTPAGMNGTSLATTVTAGDPVPAHAVLSEMIHDRVGNRRLVSLHDPTGVIVRDLIADTDQVHGPPELRRRLDEAIEAELAQPADPR